MNIDRHDKAGTKILLIMARLQEFYTNDEMLSFYGECDRRHVFISEAIEWIEKELMSYLRINPNIYPDFKMLVKKYRALKGWEETNAKSNDNK